jgi:dTDP-4-amino-4,6-dideoxygalactose transaminase
MIKLENKYVNLDKTDIDSVLNAISFKELSGRAKIVGKYEEVLVKYFESKYAMSCNSGTGGIELILRSLKIGIGDEVILPPTAPVMCILPILAIGAIPIFVDIESENSFGFSIKDLKYKLSNKVKAILTVPMWGYPVPMEELVDIAKGARIPVIEDASHCHGTKIQNRMIGTFGDCAIFSTQERKMVTTGEGGFIITNNDEYYIEMLKMRNFGRLPSDLPYFEKKVEDFGINFGLNYRINALGASLGISQLAKLEHKIKTRSNNAKIIKDGIKKLSWLKEIPILPNSRPNYYSLVLKVLDDEVSASKVGEYLDKNGIISDTYRYNYQSLYRMPAFEKYNSDCPNSDLITKSIITLPTHEGLSQEDIKHIINIINQYVPL